MRSWRSAAGLLALLAAACSGGGCAGDADSSTANDGDPVGDGWADVFDGTDDSSPERDDASATDEGVSDGASDDSDGRDDGDGAPGLDVGDGGCFVSSVGTFGECITLPACAALGDHVSTPGYCPGSASIECCTRAPNVADNPPLPTGWKLMAQSAVTSDMTTWAVAILHDPTTYPMFATTTRTFGAVDVLARVEWHPPDFLNSAIHRGVTLYSK